MLKPYYEEDGITLLVGNCLDVLRSLPEESVHCVVTSPPYYGLRDYGLPAVEWPDGWVGCLGLEPDFRIYISHCVSVFSEVRRVLRSDGTLWMVIGDSHANDTKWGGRTGGKHAAALHGDDAIGRRRKYSGLKSKDLMMIPHRLAIAMQESGWYVRMDNVWQKPNPFPESVKDRTTDAHEYVFHMSKCHRYYYDGAAIAEPCSEDNFHGSSFTRGKTFTAQNGLKAVGTGERIPPSLRNKRSVWTIPTQSYPEGHFATYPEDLVVPCIKAGCPPGGIVLDPFAGSGTTGLVAKRLGCKAILIELSPAYAKLAKKRLCQGMLQLHADAASC